MFIKSNIPMVKWLGCGLATGIVVLVANVLSISDAKFKMHDTIRTRGKVPGDYDLTCVIGLACLFKLAMYTVLGPIGLYRVCVGVSNRYHTGDRGYIRPITYPAWWTIDSSNDYMMWPIGDVSWVPLVLTE